MDKKNFYLPVLIIFALHICHTSSYSLSFGKNKVRVDIHKWQITETPHFIIYYYPESEPLLDKVGYYLEKAYKHVTEDLDVTIKEKPHFFLYTTHNHFEQTNISTVGEGTGGFSEPTKNRFVIPLTGSERELEHVITHEFTHIAQFSILYGGFWRSLRILKFIFYPLWTMEGLAEYESQWWDSYDDMIMRDAALSDQLIPLESLHNFGHLKNHQIWLAYKQSQSAVTKIEEKFGHDKMVEFYKTMRDVFDINVLFIKVLDSKVKDFDKEWRDELKEKYEKQAKGKEEPARYGERITYGKKFEVFNTNPAWSSKDDRIAYISDRAGYNDIFVINPDGTHESVLGRWAKTKIDNIHTEGRALSWSNDGESLVFVGEKLKKNNIYIVEMRRKRIKGIKIPIKNVRSPIFTSDGEGIIFVGMDRGINDIYQVDIDGKNLRRLNLDPQDDDCPSLSPEGDRIVYTSEIEKQNDLFIRELEDDVFIRLTETDEDELSPVWSPDGKYIYFIADYDGIYNLYRVSVANKGEPERLTDIVTGIFTPTISDDGSGFAFACYREGCMDIYRGSIDSLSVYSVSKEEDEYSPDISRYSLTKTDSQILSSREDFFSGSRPYRLKVSTDWFFPILFYSTIGGLYTGTYWQGSDMLGNHTASSWIEYASDPDWLNYRVYYGYRRLRPQFNFNFFGRNSYYYNNDDELIRKLSHTQAISVVYPLNYQNRLEIGAITVHNKKRNKTQDDEITRERENVAAYSLVRDTTDGKYLYTLNGYRTNLTYYQSRPVWGGDFSYNTYLLETQKYFHLPGDNTFAIRVYGGGSEGRDREDFLLGGAFALRGVPRREYDGSATLLLNSEFRFFIFPEIDYHVWWMWPDFYFKSIRGVVFTDVGNVWDYPEDPIHNSEWKNSVGLGLKIDTFLLEMFPFIMNFDYAWRTDKKGNVFYFSIGPIF